MSTVTTLGGLGLGLSALANNTNVAAYAIQPSQSFSQFTTVTVGALNSCILPALLPPGVMFTIRNDSATAAQLNIFPPVGGQINTAGANVALALLVAGTVSIVSGGSNLFYTIVNQSVGAGFATSPIVTTAGATLLTIAQSGSLVTINNGAGYTITLPTPVGNAGVNYKFLQITAAQAHTVVIDSSGAGLLQGMWINVVGGGAASGVGGDRSLEFLTGASLRGDIASVVSDGAKWNIMGNTQAAAGMAFV